MTPDFRHVTAVADPKILKRGGLIYRKCAQQNICLLHGKTRFFEKKYEPRGGAPPLLNRPLDGSVTMTIESSASTRA